MAGPGPRISIVGYELGRLGITFAELTTAARCHMTVSFLPRRGVTIATCVPADGEPDQTRLLERANEECKRGSRQPMGPPTADPVLAYVEALVEGRRPWHRKGKAWTQHSSMAALTTYFLFDLRYREQCRASTLIARSSRREFMR
jgi:hypothetical protein